MKMYHVDEYGVMWSSRVVLDKEFSKRYGCKMYLALEDNAEFEKDSHYELMSGWKLSYKEAKQDAKIHCISSINQSMDIIERERNALKRIETL